MRRLLCLLGLLSLMVSPALAAEKVQVFVLAGQSNMQGHGKINSDANEGQGSLTWMVRNPETAPKFQHLIDPQGQWRERDDVLIWYFERRGKLAPGFGVQTGFIGPELGFGQVVGEALEAPVLLIKLAWGGKSLGQDFRPPSSGGEVGPYYREVVTQTRQVLAEAKTLFPEHADRGFELAGFGWHQGWNDRINQQFNEEYERNMANFIRDIRKDLGVPKLPFVIAETGMSGPEETHPRALSLMQAQAAVAKYDEFQGNVAFVGTRNFYRPPEQSPSRQGYHWNSNAETYYLIGESMGQAMVKLLERKE